MPEPVAPKEVRHFELDTEPFILPSSDLGVEKALALVNRSFEDWESHRGSTIDPKWQAAKDLYLGRVTPKYWDRARRYPRSGIPNRLVYDQVSTAYPNMVTALFGRQPYWFDIVEAENPAAAEAKRQRLNFIFEQPDKNGVSGVMHMKKSMRNHLLPMGTALGQVGWDPIRNDGFFRHLDPRNVYLSPRAKVSVDSSPAWIYRTTMSVTELKAMEGAEFNLPPDNVLHFLAINRSNDQGDQTRDLSEALRALGPTSMIHEPNPADDEVEVMIYESRDRVIWTLGRKWVAFNGANPYGFLTLVGSVFSDDGDGIYGEGVGDLVGFEQTLQQNLTNSYIDELSLHLNPPMAQSKFQTSQPDQTVWRPGQKYPGDDPTKTVVPLVANRQVTGDVFTAIGLSDQRAQRRTGMNALAQQGTPTPSNANRTATGVSAQTSAVSLRLLEAIQNFEDFYVLPALYKMDRILQIMDQRAVAPGRGPAGELNQIPTAASGTPSKFKMFGATRLRAREALMPILPFLTQYYLNPEVAKHLQTVGKAIDYEELNRMIEDTADIGERYNIVRDMNQQEQQLAQRQSAQAQQMQEKMLELQTRTAIADSQNETKLAVEQIKAESKGHESAEKSATELSKALITRGKSGGGGSSNGAKSK